MKVGPFEITRSERQVSAAADPEPRRRQPELGASGSNNLDGYLIESEYNPDLRGSEALKTFDRMLRSDDAVAEAYGHIAAPILNASWEIQPAGETPEDREVAAAVEKAYFGGWLAPGWGWNDHLDEALEHLALGCYPFEIGWHVVEDELTIEDPEGEPEPPEPDAPESNRRERSLRTLPRRQFLTFRRFDPRLPQSITHWNEQDGDLVSITQSVMKDGEYEEIEIPLERLVLYTHRRRGHEWTGRSLLRSAYKAWVFKELVEKVAGIGVERHGVGTWIGYLPAGRENDAAIMSRVEEMLKNVRSGAQGYLVAPGPKQAAGTEGQGYLFEVETPGGGAPDFVKLLEYFRGGIKGAMLVRFSELGHGRTGARATGDTQSEVWYDALHSVARYVEDVHAEAIKRFVRANFSLQRYPKLVASDIESRSLEEYALAISRLVQATAITADRPARDTIRKAVDLPPEEEEPVSAQAQPTPDAADQPQPDEIEEED